MQISVGQGQSRTIKRKRVFPFRMHLKQAVSIVFALALFMVYTNEKATKNIETNDMLMAAVVQQHAFKREVGFDPAVQGTENINDYIETLAPFPNVSTPSQVQEYPPEGSQPPVILIWQAMEYQMKLYKRHLEYIQPAECGGCQVTTNRSLQATSAAIVHFNSPTLQHYMDVPDPSKRNSRQIYAFWSRETPGKTYSFHETLKDPRFDGIFNITMNFRQDSDIVDYFGNTEYELRQSKLRRKKTWFNDTMAAKDGLVIWAVSNCMNTFGAKGRLKYAQKLFRAGLNVSTFGSCFDNLLLSQNEFLRYKFYLAFENSVHCPDYVSEKFWRNGIRSTAVPIVWGPNKKDVEEIAPKHSYIHTDDFSSAEELVKYINYLDRNHTAYMEYHKWRNEDVNFDIKDEDIEPNHRSTLCRLCKRVTQRPLKHSIVPSVHRWLYETRYTDDLCFKG